VFKMTQKQVKKINYLKIEMTKKQEQEAKREFEKWLNSPIKVKVTYANGDKK